MFGNVEDAMWICLTIQYYVTNPMHKASRPMHTVYEVMEA
jgi:hypothetical protein